MERSSIRQSSFAVLAALIWGTTFVAQSVGAEYVPALAFIAARSIIAFVFLLILCLILRQVRRSRGKPATSTRSRNGAGAGLFFPAKGAGNHLLRQSRIHHGAVYRAGSHFRHLLEKAGAEGGVVQRGAGCGGSVLPVRHGELYHLLR